MVFSSTSGRMPAAAMMVRAMSSLGLDSASLIAFCKAIWSVGVKAFML
jgi:hypothetical protein